MGNRNYKLKTRYSISESLYQTILTGQDYKCKICGEPHREDAKLHVDHHKVGDKEYCHGLLCGLCNSMIAHGKHNVEILKKAIDYLNERW